MQLENIQNITVLGTGMMGPGIAMLFSRAGYKTIIWGPTPQDEKIGRINFERNLSDLIEQNILSPQQADNCRQNTTVTSDWETATKNADFVAEAVPEILDLKQEIFSKLAASCPAHTILSSNTSTLLPTNISKNIKPKNRMLVAHFWNPAHLVPLVEVCPHDKTDQETIDLTMQLLKKIGQEPVHIKKEILGFIGNRIMHAMNREALALVSNGVCTPEDIDKVILTSFGPRFANLGLLEYLDFCGLENIQRIQNYLYADLDTTSGALAIINEQVEKNELGCKTGKGLFDWSVRDKDGPRKRRDQEFLRRMKEKS